MITTNRPAPYAVAVESAIETEVWHFRDSFDALMEFATQCIDAKNAVLNSKSWAPYHVTFTWIPQDIEYIFNPWDEDTVEEAFELLDEDFKNALWHAKKDIEE